MFALRLTLAVALIAVAAPLMAASPANTSAVWSDGHKSILGDEELMRYAVASPSAGYPEAAQRTNASGSGLYELRINKAGATTAVTIVKSSGNAALDKAATDSFKKWRFKPGIFQSVRIPVSWSVNRVR